jgi:tRNA A-37 threonylcarbamoyl transferase component Bud32
MSLETIQPFEIKKIQRLIESKQVEELVDCLSRLEIHAEPIGVGGNAEVLAIEGGMFAKVCLKKIKQIPQMKCNDIDTETKIQAMVRKAGVRTPLALVSFEANGQEYLIMERVIGSTIAEIAASPSKLPEDFDASLFMGTLGDMVHRMHEAGIYHRDLHTRNVMVDDKGQPVIIDFGTATVQEGSGGGDFIYEESVQMYDHVNKKYSYVSGAFKDDLVMIKNMRGTIAGAHTNNTLTKKTN